MSPIDEYQYNAYKGIDCNEYTNSYSQDTIDSADNGSLWNVGFFN